MEQTISDESLARITKLLGGAQCLFLGMPALADVDRIVDEIDIADGDQTIIAQPDMPRNITGTLTDVNDSVSAVVTITGKDILNRPVQEVMTIVAGVGKVFVGTKIFAVVDKVTVSGTTGGAAGDTIAIGIGDLIGLPFDISEAGELLHAYLNGTKITPDAVATGESTSGVNCTSGTYDGAKWLQVFMKTAAQQ